MELKKRDLVRQIANAALSKGLAFERARSGTHDIYPLDGLIVPIPRHRELGEGFADEIRKECEPKLGRGWWR